MKALIIDDHSLIRRGLKADILDIDGNVQVFSAETFQLGLQILEKEHIDIVILDIDIPGGEGVRMVDSIRAINNYILILVHSGYDEKEFALPFLKAGANGFLSKQASTQDFIQAWQTLVAKGRFITPAVQKLLIDTLGSGTAPHIKNPISCLSPRELWVMKLINEGKWNKEIAVIMKVKQNTVSTYKKRLFEKLDIKDENELAKIVTLYCK